MVHGAVDTFKLLQKRHDPGAPIGQVPEFLGKFDGDLKSLAAFWDGHECEKHLLTLRGKFSASPMLAE
eukprot:6200009-Pyramimonas_sp.AAC.1